MRRVWRSSSGQRDAARTSGADGLATDLLWLAAMRCWWNAVRDDGCAEVAAALARLAPMASSPRLLLARAYAAPPSRAAELIDEVTTSAVDASGPEAMWLLGNAVHILGGFDLASTLLRSAAAGLRTEGRLGPLARVLSLQAWADAHLGRWATAGQAADEAQRLADETAQPVWQAGATLCRALLRAAAGDHGTARDLLEDAHGLATATGARFIQATVQHARGFAA